MFSWDETIPQQTRIKPSVKEEEQKTRGVISRHHGYYLFWSIQGSEPNTNTDYTCTVARALEELFNENYAYLNPLISTLFFF
jgi:hypothetical protein